jgi:hypothetical protein
MVEHERLSAAPVFVKDLRTVFRGDGAHESVSWSLKLCAGRSKQTAAAAAIRRWY